jgi:NAD(P)-dependent dehydrogenase (short-subunit alcohol dehydrogenase family)
MTDAPKVWLVTGASRGIGAEIVAAALAAGDKVVAGVRNAMRLSEAFANREGLFVVDLDVQDSAQIAAAVDSTVKRFGSVDILVNNAGYGQIGAFELTTEQEADEQFATNVFGLFNMTRAVLPLLRKRRSGHIFNISSIAGLRGGPGASIYAASKFAVEGFTESLSSELAPFGIRVTIVEPGHFRTDFLDARSLRTAQPSIPDYEKFARRSAEALAAQNHNQLGDPARLAEILVCLSRAAEVPRRLILGSDAYAVAEAKISEMHGELARWRDVSLSTDRPG